MKKIRKYLKKLDFEYAISYSGLRGQKFKTLEENNKAKIIQIEKEIESARFMQKPILLNQIDILNDEINLSNLRIINLNGELHKSCEPIYRFEKGDKETITLLKILNIKFEKSPIAACLPTFRDSIVFYSKENSINGILQICFGCNYIKDENDEELEVDHKIYQLLQNKLIRLGHQIKNE